MYSHNMVGSNDLAASKAFYDAVFTAVGGNPGALDEAKGRVSYIHMGSFFVVTKPLNGEPATVANGNTIGFLMENPDQCEAWHAAGVAAGGTAVEDPPGPRPFGEQTLYLAYLRDPTGHKLCALHFMG
jgi:catechol 2,3-dioxygenase-like lactoylglutathione lyase family enzyme